MDTYDSLYFNYIKKIIDFMIGLVGTIVIFLPTLLLIAIFYQFGKDKGPIFFTQNRLGKNGELFKVIKFRSMRVNAEELLQADKKLYQKYLDNSYKLPPNEDPRLTTIGNFIRKTSIDEFPQFFNILKGDMSFIGPRPILETELKEYTYDERKELLSVKPGVTGWWQVSGRSDVFYPERCQLELYYVRNLSMGLDFKILLKTILSVFKMDGAH